MSKMRISLALLFLFLGAGSLIAQAPGTAVTGTVRDTAGLPIPQTDVIARDVAAGYEYNSVTDQHGRYWLRRLPPGRYDLTARRIDVGSVVRRGVQLSVGQEVTVDFVLETRPVELPPLEVIDREPPIQTTQADISFAVSREQIIELPEETRGFLELAQLAPGATRAIDTGEPIGPTAVGALSPYYGGVVVDGVSIIGGELNELMGSLPLTAIQEFEVLTATYSAEYGQAASGIVNAVTRRGSNRFDVDGFMLYRHQSLNAQGVFESAKPDFNRRHWGVSAGGPIKRDRTHWIAAFERKVENNFATVETGGVFPALEGTFELPFEDNLLFSRLDHRFNNAHELTVRYAGQIFNRRTDIGPSRLCGFPSGEKPASEEFGAEVDGSTHSLVAIHRWNSGGGGSVNEARLSFQRRSEDRVAQSGAPWLVYPTFCDGGNAFFWKLGNSRLEFRDDFTVALSSGLGSHRLKTGVLVSYVDVNDRTGNITNGLFQFSADTASTPDILLLALEGISAVQSNLQLGIYVQDQWSPAPNLTLDVGLRYDIETNGTNQGFVAPEGGSLPFVSASERPVDANNLAPRLSFAWDPFRDARTVVRGGFGVFYNQTALAFAGLESSRNRIAVIFDPGTTNLDSIPIDPDSVPISPTFLGKEMESPSTSQFSLGLARVVPGQIVLSVDGILVQGRNIPIQRRFSDGFVQLVNAGEAEGKMLLLRARREADVGWFDVNYTLGSRKGTTDVWFDFTPQNDPASEDFSGELGPAAWDERHRLVVLGGARAQWGTGISLKSIYSSGRPYNIVTGLDDNGDFEANDRPPGVGRNSARGPDFFTLDLGLYQRFPIGGGELELRLNIYNLTNRTNFVPESVAGNQQSLVFGQPLAAAHKRQAEVGLFARF